MREKGREGGEKKGNSTNFWKIEDRWKNSRELNTKCYKKEPPMKSKPIHTAEPQNGSGIGNLGTTDERTEGN